MITEPEPEPEPEPPEELLEEVDLGSSSAAPGAAAMTESTALTSLQLSHTSAAPTSAATRQAALPAAPPTSPTSARCVCLVVLAFVLILGTLQFALGADISSALGEALRKSSVAHDSAAVCGLDAAELAYWSQEGVRPERTPSARTERVPDQMPTDRVQVTQDCVDDPSKVLLGSDCAAYSLHPGCEYDLHALYDGAIYGKEFSGTTVGMVCPRTCGLCP